MILTKMGGAAGRRKAKEYGLLALASYGTIDRSKWSCFVLDSFSIPSLEVANPQSALMQC